MTSNESLKAIRMSIGTMYTPVLDMLEITDYVHLRGTMEWCDKVMEVQIQNQE